MMLLSVEIDELCVTLECKVFFLNFGVQLLPQKYNRETEIWVPGGCDIVDE
jgi:hypothetical protein